MQHLPASRLRILQFKQSLKTEVEVRPHPDGRGGRNRASNRPHPSSRPRRRPGSRSQCMIRKSWTLSLNHSGQEGEVLQVPIWDRESVTPPFIARKDHRIFFCFSAARAWIGAALSVGACNVTVALEIVSIAPPKNEKKKHSQATWVYTQPPLRGLMSSPPCSTPSEGADTEVCFMVLMHDSEILAHHELGMERAS